VECKFELFFVHSVEYRMSERQPFCTCENTYEVDEDGKCLSDVPCINCRIHRGYCECSKEAECEFCVEREPFTPTKEAESRAQHYAKEIYTHMEKMREEWFKSARERVNNWERRYFNTHFENDRMMCECYECLLSPNIQQAFIEKMRREFQDILELPLWYEAFKRGDPVHKDPSAWTSKQTWKLVWNARK